MFTRLRALDPSQGVGLVTEHFTKGQANYG